LYYNNYYICSVKKKQGRPKGEPTTIYCVRHNAAIVKRVKRMYGKRLQKIMQNTITNLDTETDGN